MAELLEKSKRTRAVPLRKIFLQLKDTRGIQHGPLHLIVQSHGASALDLYLLVQLIAVGEPYRVTLEAGGWARALGFSGPSGRATVSRTWKGLEDLKLISRDRVARKASITLLREDGSGSSYSRPNGGRQIDERYLKIPLDYWLQEWYRELSLPAKALLLVALSLSDRFSLPIDKAPQWYGLSGDTAHRGFSELERAGLLQHEDQYKKAALTTQGWTVDRRYTLQPPFGPKRKPSLIEESSSD